MEDGARDAELLEQAQYILFSPTGVERHHFRGGARQPRHDSKRLELALLAVPTLLRIVEPDLADKGCCTEAGFEIREFCSVLGRSQRMQAKGKADPW